MTTTSTPSIPSTINAHSKLALHLQRHKYTKGRYKGDAPADTSRRDKTHFRVIYHAYSDEYRVLFHNTYILVAKPDGTVMIDSGGWHDSPTTRKAIAEVTYLFTGTSLWLRSYNGNGLKQCTTDRGGAYYDGLILDSTKPGCPQISPIKPLMKYIKDRTKTKQVINDAKDFRAALPLLHACQTQPTYGDVINARRSMGSLTHSPHTLTAALTTPELWPALIMANYHATAAATWRAIYNAITKHMVLEVPV